VTEPTVVYEAGPRTEKPLSERQRAILAFIVAYKEATQGHSPTIREIGQAVDISSTSLVNYYLNQLEARGYIERTGNCVARDIRIPGARWIAPGEPGAAATPPVVAQPTQPQQPPVAIDSLRDYATVDDVADALDIHPESVRRLIRQGRIQARKLGNQWLVSRLYLSGYAAAYRSETGNRPLGEPAAWERVGG
jgi:excisionase family DNA binding protein